MRNRKRSPSDRKWRKLKSSERRRRRDQVHKRDNYTCKICYRHISNLQPHEILTIDHIIPAALGGSNAQVNLQTACSTCNFKKRDKTLCEIE